MSKSFSNGIIILIFLLLFIQFVFFVLKAVDSYRSRSDDVAEKSTELVEEVAIVSRDTMPGMRKKSYNPVQKKGVNKAPQVAVEEKQDVGTAKEQPIRKQSVYSSNTDVESGSEGKPFLREKKYHNYPIELNRADTSDFNSLYGIGAYYAKKIVEYREELGGSFVAAEQLMEVWGIDSTRFYAFSDRLFVDSTMIIHIDLYALDIDSLAKHPYIGSYAAKGIERYRRMVSEEDFTVDKLVEYNIIAPEKGAMLKLYHKCAPFKKK